MKNPTGRLRAAALVMALVLAVGGVLSLSPVKSRADTLSDLQKKLETLSKEETALKSQLAAYKNNVAKQQEYSDSLKAEISNATQQIDLLQDQIDLLSAEMDEKTAEMDQKQADIETAEAAIDAQLALFSQRLRVISQSGNLTSLQMLLNTEDYVDYLLKEKVVSRIAQSDQHQIDLLNQQIDGLNEEKADLQKAREGLEADRQAVEELKAVADAKKRELDDLYAESNRVLKSLQNSVSSVNAQLAQKQKEEAALDAQIKKLIAESKKSSSAYGGNYTAGSMEWPVPAVHNISSGYGYRWGSLHKGIDIANGSVPIYGKDIVAAADGKVIYTNTSGWGGGYGLFVMVDHGNDSRGRHIVTLYAHMSAVLVNPGDLVAAGATVLGRAGATGNVTGPHLHFEVRVDGTCVDPFSNGYLSR